MRILLAAREDFVLPRLHQIKDEVFSSCKGGQSPTLYSIANEQSAFGLWGHVLRRNGSDVDPICTQDKDRVIISSLVLQCLNLELRSCVGGADSAIIELFTWIIINIFICNKKLYSMWSSMGRRRTGRVKWDPKQVGRLIGKSQCGTRSHRPSVSWHVDSDVHRFHRRIPCMHSRILPVSQFWMLIWQLERDLPVTRQVAFAVHLLGIRNVATCSILFSRSATNTCIRRKRHPANRQTAPISSTHPWHLSWKKYMEAGPASWVGILSNHDAGSVVSDGYPLDRYILFYSPHMQNWHSWRKSKWQTQRIAFFFSRSLLAQSSTRS